MTKLTPYKIHLLLLTISILTVMPNNPLYADEAISQQSEKVLIKTNEESPNETPPIKSTVNLKQTIKSPLIDNEASGKALKESLQTIKAKLEQLKHKDHSKNEVKAITPRDTVLDNQAISGN